jgi:hypothetical protein
MRRTRRPLLVLIAVGALVGGLEAAAGAGATRNQTVRCVGTGDFCSATVSIASGAGNRSVTVVLTDTNLKLVGISRTPQGASYTIRGASFRRGGSEYRFNLYASGSNPRQARIVLLFSAGAALPRQGKLGGQRDDFTAKFSVGSGMAVSVTGGGAGTSNCTSDETSESFVTKGNNENHTFGFYARNGGSCDFQWSYSWFTLRVRDRQGRLVGAGRMWFGQRDYRQASEISCRVAPFVGVRCVEDAKQKLTIARP